MYFWKSPYLVDSLDGHSPNLQPKDKEDIPWKTRKSCVEIAVKLSYSL